MGAVVKVYWSNDLSWPFVIALLLHTAVCGLSWRATRLPDRAELAVAAAVPLLGSAWWGGLLWLHTVIVAVSIGLLLAWRAGKISRQSVSAVAILMGTMALAQVWFWVRILWFTRNVN